MLTEFERTSSGPHLFDLKQQHHQFSGFAGELFAV
jgi:hypothetical protein